MTAKHILEGVMQWTGARSHYRCSILLGIDAATISRLSAGKYAGLRTQTLDHIQRKTDIPIQTLWDWYRLPDGAVLGRVSK